MFLCVYMYVCVYACSYVCVCVCVCYLKTHADFAPDIAHPRHARPERARAKDCNRSNGNGGLRVLGGEAVADRVESDAGPEAARATLQSSAGVEG